MKRHLFYLLFYLTLGLSWTVPFANTMAQTSSNWIGTIAWSPDGTKIATGSKDGTIQLWNASTGQSLSVLRQGGPGQVLAVAWNSDSLKLATGGVDQPIVIWNTSTGQPSITFNEDPPRYTGVVWSPDGTKIAGVNDGGVFRIWDATTGQLLNTMPPAGYLYSVAWSPDGNKIATGRDNKIILWSSGGQNLATLQENDREVISVAWNSDSIRIATANVKGRVHIWDTSTNQIARTFTGHTDIAYSVAWSPDGTKLASASADQTVRIWDVATGQTTNTIQSDDRVFAVAWSPDGTKIGYGTSSGGIQITSPTPSTLKVQYYPDPTARGATVDAIIPDFNIVNTGSTAVPLSELKIRYYFTRDSAPQTIIFNCDFTELPGGCGSITGQVVTLPTPVTGADSYIEIGFTSGTLAANSETLDILVDVVKQDESDFTQTNDYSFDDRDPSFTDWTKVTLYRNGTLVWGTSPS